MFLKKLRNIFLTGILVILPLVASIYILWYLFVFIDNLVRPMVILLFKRDLPGAGIILTLLVIMITGVFATNVIGKKIITVAENLLLKIPLYRNIYISFKQFLEGLFHQNKDSFEQVIIFEYPRKGLYQMGFITKETSSFFNSLTGKELYNVFLPTTPNPTSGMFIMVPKEEAIIIDISIEEALKLIISAGILTPEKVKRKEMKGK